MKKMSAILLVLAMLCNMVPVCVMAEEVVADQAQLLAEEQAAAEAQAAAEEAARIAAEEAAKAEAERIAAEEAAKAEAERIAAEEAAKAAAEAVATEEPAAEPTVTPEPTEVPEVVETPAPERFVDIYCDNEVIQIGDTVTLKSEISGFDGVSVSYDWQCLMDVNGEEEWVSCGGGASYSFTMTEELMGCDWRLVIVTND